MALFSSFGEVNLDALDATITDNAVDIFVYDTRKDSDGGKWRKRTKKTSWYNETLNTATRGSRRDFPAVAVIVAETSKVTIYDGDDPDMPMWMVFNSTGPSYLIEFGVRSITAKNGKLASGCVYDLYVVDFISEKQFEYLNTVTNTSSYNIANRNSTPYKSTVYQSYGIIDRSVNDVAMTVLPNAPIDPATGLPTPTIAVATNGGLSIIKDDYSVVERQNTWNNDGGVWEVQFDEKHGGYWYSTAYYSESHGTYPNHALVVGYEPDINATSTLSQANGNYQDRIHLSIGKSPTGNGLWNAQHIPDVWLIGAWSNANGGKITFNNQGEQFGCQYGLTLFDGAYETIGSTARNSLGCYVSSSYNTGWMHGDIKGAFLSDTDATNVTGGNLVSNGDFSNGTTDWSSDQILSVTGGVASVQRNAGPIGQCYQSITTVVGKRYVISVQVTALSHGFQVYAGSTASPNSLTMSKYAVNSTGYHTYHFVAAETSTRLDFSAVQSGTATASFDNIVVTLSEEDRSVNNDPLQVFGTITKTPVATGADLVAYSGFSASTNYLKQPFNSGLAIGNSDFSSVGWFKKSTSSNTSMIIYASNGANQVFDVRVHTDLKMLAQITDDLFTTREIVSAKGTTVNDNIWHQYHVVRRSNVLHLYLDGNLLGTSAAVEANITDPLSIVIGGEGLNAFQKAFQGSLALIRFSRSAPSAEQIKKIYEDEKVLFQENAKCTLYGSSDAVTALAYDDKTNLLHVGTSSGRSDFKGLRRINNTTTGITTAISASNGLIAEQ